MAVPISNPLIVKIVLCGEIGVGKSCLLLRFGDDEFFEKYLTTIGVDFKMKKLDFQGRELKIQVWDFPQKHEYPVVTSSYYRGCDLVMFCADVTNPKSFELSPWIENATQGSRNEPFLGCVVGTKCDIIEGRKVSKQEAETISQSLGFDYFETSSKTGQGFEDCLRHYLPLIIQMKEEKNLKNNNNTNNFNNNSHSSESNCNVM